MPPTTATPSLEELLTVLTIKPSTPAASKVTTSSTTLTTPSTTVAITSTTVTTPSTTVTTPKTTVTTPSSTVTTPSTTETTPRTTVTTARTTVATPKTTVTTPITVFTTSAPVISATYTTMEAPTVGEEMTTKTTTVVATSLSTKNILTTTTTPSISEISTAVYQEKTEKISPVLTSLEKSKEVTVYDNTTFVTTSTSKAARPTEPVTLKVNIQQISNRTEAMELTTEPFLAIKTVPTVNVQHKPTTEVLTTSDMTTTVPTTTPMETTIKTETTKKETTIRILPTTIKFKPKEIWIRPAQKGESPIVETKIKTTHEFPRYRSANNKEMTPVVTTPKTIIVSIIPTSVSYSTFKKIALTSSFISTKNSSTAQSYNKTENEFTKPMQTETSTPPIKLSPLSRKDLLGTSYFINKTLVPSTSVTPKPKTSSTKLTTLVTTPSEVIQPMSRINRTNSMTTDINKNVSTSVTTTSSATGTTLKQNDSLTNPTTRSIKPSNATISSTEPTTKHLLKYVTHKKANVAPVTKKYSKPTSPPMVVEKEFKKANVTKSLAKLTTDGPSDDEEFHILTEPEHITAVMGEKGTERSSVDLISVIGIAGGVMMAVITVAVIIVMIERCKKPRYEDVRKINDIRMQVMIDNNDQPPPYVRSIFHTPLPGKFSVTIIIIAYYFELSIKERI